VRLQGTVLQDQLSQDRLSGVRVRFICRTIWMFPIMPWHPVSVNTISMEKRKDNTSTTSLVSTIIQGNKGDM
jgi:hypothetical protein